MYIKMTKVNQQMLTKVSISIIHSCLLKKKEKATIKQHYYLLFKDLSSSG